MKKIECPLCDGEGCDPCEGSGEIDEGGVIDVVFKDDDSMHDHIEHDDAQDADDSDGQLP